MNKYGSHSSNYEQWDFIQDKSKMLSLFAKAKVSYQSLNNEGIILEVNAYWLDLLGFAKEEVIGRWFGDFLCEDSRQFFMQSFKEICSADEAYESEFKIICSDGSIVTASISRLGSFDEDENLIKTHCILQNIRKIESERIVEQGDIESFSEIKRNTIIQDLEKREISLKKITESSPLVLFQYSIKNLQFKLHYVSDNILDHTGYSKDWLTEKHSNFRKLLHPDDRAMLLSTVLNPKHFKSPQPLIFRIISKKQELKWIKIYYSYSKIQGQNTWTGVAFDITAEYKLKEELDDVNLKYSKFVSSSASVIAELSFSGHIKSLSKSLTAFTGYEPEEFIGKHFLRTGIFPLDQIWYMKSIFKDLLKRNVPKEPVEYRWKHKNGELRYGEALFYILGDEKGASKLQVILFDVTNKKLLEIKDNQRHKDLNFLFEASISMQKIHTENDFYKFIGIKLKELIPEGIINVNSINDEYTQLKVEIVVGLTKVMEKTVGVLFNAALKGFTIKLKPGAFDYAKPGKLDSFNSSLYEMTMGEIPEFVCKKVEKLISFDRSMEVSLGTVDQIMGGVSIFLRKESKVEKKPLIEAFLREASNVLIRIKVQNRLEKSELIHRSLAENTENLILRLDKKANILYLNPVAETKVFNEKQHSFKTPLFQSGLHLDETSMLLEEFHKVIKDKKSQTTSFPITRNGITNYFDWYLYPEFSGDKIESVLIHANDITDRKSLENELSQSVEFRRKLYAILAHDLRTPFNSMLGFFELLHKNYDDLSDEKRKDYINILKLSADKAYDLLDSVLLWSRDVENLKQGTKEYCLIKNIIDDIEILNSTKLNEKSIQIIKDFDPDACINADKNMLSAIFRNLISNAIKYSSSNSTIHISIKEVKDEYIFKIKDSGVGMDITEISSGDDINKKVTKPGTAGEKGSGLGLIFVKDFVHRSSGKIWIESKPGKGTTVYVQLPRCMN